MRPLLTPGAALFIALIELLLHKKVKCLKAFPLLLLFFVLLAFGNLKTEFGLLPETVVDELVAVSTFASLPLFRLDVLPGTQLIVDPLPLWPTLLLLLLLFFDFQSFIFMALNKIAYSLRNLNCSLAAVARIFACLSRMFF